MAAALPNQSWMAQNVILEGGVIYKISSNIERWIRKGITFICNSDSNGTGLSIVKILCMATGDSTKILSVNYIGSNISDIFNFGYNQSGDRIDVYMLVKLNKGTNIGIHALGFSVIEKTSLTEIPNIITPTKIL